MANGGSPKSGDIPPYPEMILAAIEALGDKNGSSKSAISSYIEEKAAPKDPNTPKRGRGRPPKAKDSMADAVKEAVAKATTGMPRGRGRPPGPSSAKKAKVTTEAASPAPASGSAPAKRGRGRPRKVAA
ncbi:unnamed protein product [Triticum turgidum subsp. durum]|uniref:H15 domain-containing protein n=1 Tax=Triticum turgidum subsp. durum TaxID=4567 RepID=A0A9R1ALI9_TRITD|nr:unnamed protein product [Triticum turgidum subsp. durum]